MAKTLLLTILIAILAFFCFFLVDTEETVEKPGYCLYHGIYIKEGEYSPAPIGKCMKVKCVKSDTAERAIAALTCALFVPRQGCNVSRHDLSKRYPACCPREICPPGYED